MSFVRISSFESVRSSFFSVGKNAQMSINECEGRAVQQRGRGVLCVGENTV